MTVIEKAIYLFIFIILFASCSTTKKLESECILDKENNIISGDTPEAKEFRIAKQTLHCCIEELLLTSKCWMTHKEKGLYDKIPNKFVPYHIHGCQDTAWAKQAMANHLMDKYHINRYDSTYYDTVYNIKVIDESKLVYSQDSCHRFISLGSIFNGVVVTEYKCMSWGSICSSMIPRGMNKKTNSIEIEDRLGLYDIMKPAYIYEKHGLQAYQHFLLEYLGVEMNFERIDTIKIGVYEFRE